MTILRLDVVQSEYLPAGGSEVDAIVVVSAEDAPAPSPRAAAIVIVLDVSGSMGEPPAKLTAAQAATRKALDKLVEGTHFAIVAGNHEARVVYPHPAPGDGPAEGVGLGLLPVSTETRARAKDALWGLRAAGGTAISTWLAQTRALLERAPGIRYGVLLTDGRNESEAPDTLEAELRRCEGRFQIQCFGVGTDWERAELERVSGRLQGATGYIRSPELISARFEEIAARVMALRVPSASLGVETPVGVELALFKQVLPGMLALTDRVARRQEDDAGQWRVVSDPNPERPLSSVFALGALAPRTPYKYHLRLVVPPEEVGRRRRAAQLTLLVGADTVAQGRVVARWTDDPALVSRPDPEVSRFTGPSELSETIQLLLSARERGDPRGVETHGRRALELAARSTNRKALTGLIDKVVGGRASREDEYELDDVSRQTQLLLGPETGGDSHQEPPRGR